MFRYLMIIVIMILPAGLIGCHIRTPEIRGIVLDEETKQPVEGAWISGTIGIKTKTVAGDVGGVVSLESPHTRTGKEGIFMIPRKKIKKPPFPVSFGSEVDRIGIGARAVDDREGGIILEGVDLKEFLRREIVEIKIEIKPVERTEEEYFSHLQSLYNYCLTGRFGIEIPPVEGGCDEWELNFAIIKHERYLNKNLINEKNRSHNSIILEQLGYLYEKKEKFEKAIENLRRAKEIRFFRSQDLEKEIERIQQKIEGVKK